MVVLAANMYDSSLLFAGSSATGRLIKQQVQAKALLARLANIDRYFRVT